MVEDDTEEQQEVQETKVKKGKKRPNDGEVEEGENGNPKKKTQKK